MLFVSVCALVAFIVLFSRLYPRLTCLECAISSVPVGVCAGAMAALLASAMTKKISDHSFMLVYAAMVYIVAEHLQPLLRKISILRQLYRREMVDIAVVALLTPFTTILVGSLFDTRYIPEHGDDAMAGGSVYSDLAIHLQIARSFVQGRNKEVGFFALESPIAAGHTLVYPFLPDFHSAVLNVQGFDYRTGMGAVGALLSVAYTLLQYLIARRFVRSRLAAVLTVILITFSGGHASWDVLLKRGFNDIFEFDPIQDSTAESGTVYWFAFYPHVMLPQRGATFAYPLVLVIFLMVWCVTGKDAISASGGDADPTAAHVMTPNEKFKFLGMAAALSGLLPFVQAHAFMAVGMVLAGVFLTMVPHWVNNLYMLRRWVGAGVIAIVVAVPMLYMISTQMGGTNKAFFNPIPVWVSCGPGWPERGSLMAKLGHIAYFWWKGLGPLVYLYVIAFALVLVRRQWAYARWMVGGSLVFVVANMVRFQPWDKDNIKLFYVWLFICMPAVGELLAAPFEVFASIFTGRVPDPTPLSILAASRKQQAKDHKDGSGSKPVDAPLTDASVAAHHAAAPNSASSATSGSDDVLISEEVASCSGCSLLPGPDPIPTALSDEILAHTNADALRLFLSTASMVLSVFLMVVLCFSGVMSVWREFRMQNVFYGAPEVQLSRFIDSHTPSDAVWMTADTHISVPAVLNGRSLVIAWTGWMDSHGYDWRPIHDDREKVWYHGLSESNEEVYKILKERNIKYILGYGMPKLAPNPPGESVRSAWLDGKLVRVYNDHERYEVFEVL